MDYPLSSPLAVSRNAFFALLATSAFFLCGSTLFADEAAERKVCCKQLHQLAELNIAFAASHDGWFPKTFDELLSVQKKPDRALLTAPSAADPGKVSYELALPGARGPKINHPEQTILIRALYTMPDGRRPVAYVDGHVGFIDGAK